MVATDTLAGILSTGQRTPRSCREPRLPDLLRASGGGAILHDAELTYSLAIPTADRLAAAARGLYDLIHSALVEAISAMGVPVSDLYQFGQPAESAHFFAFNATARATSCWTTRRSPAAARRRHRGAILQHGSILLAAYARHPAPSCPAWSN